MSGPPRNAVAASPWSNEATQVWVLRAMCAAGLAAALPTLGVDGFLPEEGDALDYRRMVLDWLGKHHRLADWSWTAVDDYPLLGELLMAPLHAASPGLARLVPMAAWVLYVACCGGLLAALLPDAPRRLTWWQGAAAGAGFRLAYQQVDLIMVDLLASALMLASLRAALRSRVRTSGLALGLGMATRYTVWPLVPAWLVVALWKAPRPLRLVDAASLAGLALLPVAPFAVRNLWLHGNPVFPLLAHLPDGTPADAALAYAAYGTGTDLGSLLQLPWNLLWTHHFERNLYDYSLGKLFLLQVLLVAMSWWQRPQKSLPHRDVQRVLMGVAGFHTLVWFYTAQQSRFLTVGLTCLLLVGVGVLASRWPPVAVTALLLLGVGSYRSVQDNAWHQLRTGVSSFAAAESEARRCRALLPEDAVVGHTRRGMGVLMERPLVYLPPHPYALPVKDLNPEFIWGADGMPGYAPFPADAPCVLRRVSP
jgi:hypothetical protein